MPLQVPTNASSVILHVALLDAAGDRVPNVAFNAAGLAFAYRVENVATWSSVSLSDGTLGTWGSGTWKHDASGMYQVGLPNAAIVANKRTFLRLTYGAIPPQFDSIEATGVPATVLNNVQNAGAGEGDYLYVVSVTDGAGAVPGAIVTIQNGDGDLVRWGRTGSGGSVGFNLNADDYSLLVSAGASYTDYQEDIAIAANGTNAVVVDPIDDPEVAVPADTALGAVYRLYTAVDWVFDLTVGALVTGWDELRFTMKASLLDDDDDEAAIQVKITNGGDVSDGMIVLNGNVDSEGEPVSIDKTWAAIEVLNAGLGTIRVTLKAAATDAIAASDDRYWQSTDDQLATVPLWRRGAINRPVPPWYNFDVKRLDGDDRAAPIQARGKIIAIEAATQSVV